jgi:hypothetical protein
MFPDRNGDSIFKAALCEHSQRCPTNPSAADEAGLANVVRFQCDGNRMWVARIGSRDGGLVACVRTPLHAAVGLLIQCEDLLWVFDETWRDKLG